MHRHTFTDHHHYDNYVQPKTKTKTKTSLPFEVVLPHKDIGHPSPGWSWPGQSAITEIIITNHDKNDKNFDD